MEMSRLTRDGTGESVSRDQILRRRERGQANIHFPCSTDHEQDWQPYPVDLLLLYVMTIHAYYIENNDWIKTHRAVSLFCYYMVVPMGLLVIIVIVELDPDSPVYLNPIPSIKSIVSFCLCLKEKSERI